jgi:hypothetical protein
MQQKWYRSVVAGIALCALVGCQSGPPAGSMALAPTSLQHRQLQSKKFDTLDEAIMLTASMEVLQDMGFMINEAESKLGLIVASKQRETDNRAQRYALIALTIFAGDGSLRGIEKEHHIRVSLVTIPDKSKKNTTVRVNFQRQVFDMENNLVKLETINEQQMYVGFFSKLSKSVFLEAHEI